AFSANLKNFLDDIVPATVAIIIALIFQYDKPPSWTIVFVIPLYVMIYIFCLGATLIVSRATAFIPDLATVVSLVNRALFFVSGVFFDLSRFDSVPLLRGVMEFNPIYQFLTAVRMC